MGGEMDVILVLGILGTRYCELNVTSGAISETSISRGKGNVERMQNVKSSDKERRAKQNGEHNKSLGVMNRRAK